MRPDRFLPRGVAGLLALAALALAVTTTGAGAQSSETRPVEGQAAGTATAEARTTEARTAEAPATAADFRDEALRHFEMSSRKLVMLSEAMPAGTYDWQPGEGVFTVARVYAHIARYNYLYLHENLGIEAPEGVAWRELESRTDKAAVREALLASIEHVRGSVAGMTEAELSRTVELYGRDVPGWAVLFQLVAHMNEHVGQAIAYARTNGIVPPWSQ
jgi:uncharacterized damage-inducible protein DinB